MRLFAGTTAVILAAVLLAGCQSAAPPTTPSPTSTTGSLSPAATPTYLCTPEAGGDESPCTQADYEEMKAKDALYAEAEAVYRVFFAESVRISREGGIDEPTRALLDTTTGDYLDNMMAIFADMHSRGVRAKGDDPLLFISRLPGVSKAGSVVALSVCIDSRGWAFFTDSVQTAEGRVGVDEVHFVRLDEALKIIGADGREASSCDQ